METKRPETMADSLWADDLLLNSSSALTYIILTITSILLIRYWINAKNNQWAKNGGRSLPGPRGVPIFGNMFFLDSKSPHLSLIKLAKVHGNVFKIQLGNRPVLVLNGMKMIQKALVKQSVVFAGRPDLFTLKAINKDNIYGPSLSFTTYDEDWKRHRKLTETSLRHFTQGSQVPFLESVAKGEAEELVRHLKVPHREGGRGIQRLIRLSVSNTMLWFMFRKRSSYDDKKFNEFIDLMNQFMKAAGSGNPLDYLPWTRFLPIKWSTGEAQSKFNKGIRGLIDENHDLYVPGAERELIEEPLKTGHVIANEEFQRLGMEGNAVLQNAFDFFAAGYETTSTTLQWAMLYMAKYPQAQSDVQREIDKAVGRKRLPTLDDRDNLPLTQSCLLEIQRYSAIAPFSIPHSTTADTLLDGYYVPKDMVVFVNLYSASFDPEVWNQPETFDPRRFLSEDGTLDADKSKLLAQFGFGRRKCVGSDLAKVNLFIFFATLLQQLNFSSPDGEEVCLDYIFGLNLSPKHFNVHIQARYMLRG